VSSNWAASPEVSSTDAGGAGWGGGCLGAGADQGVALATSSWFGRTDLGSLSGGGHLCSEVREPLMELVQRVTAAPDP
jgi:hypothetical protein